MIYDLIDKIKSKFWRRVSLFMALPVIMLAVLIMALTILTIELSNPIKAAFKVWKDEWND